MSPSVDQRENREFASEIKFLIPPFVADQVREWVRGRLDPDPNGNGEGGDVYQITSLYFDTDKFDVFHRNGSFGRCKYRIRRYGLDDMAFLERKLKTRGLLAKRRSSIRLTELERLTNGDIVSGWGGFWFHRRMVARGLKVRCRISYRRTARVAMGCDGPIRLTLDEDVRAMPAASVAFNGADEGVRLSESQVILELKFRSNMPVVFKHLVEEFALNPVRVSKYRLAAAALGCVSTSAAQPVVQPATLLEHHA